MASYTPHLIMSVLLIYGSTHFQASEESFISLVISQKGLNFIKDVLIQKAISSLTPLQLPSIQKTAKIPLIGEVHMILSNITLYEVEVSSSYVKSGDTGVSVGVTGASANLSMNWTYSYKTWLVPVTIRDEGEAHVQAEGIQVGITLNLKSREGSPSVALLECECYVKDITIKLDGGASWLYQGVVDAFDDKIASSVEEAISKKLEDEIVNLDRSLRDLPREVAVNNFVELNATLVDDPSFGDSSIEFEMNGLFSSRGLLHTSDNHKNSKHSISCNASSKMVGFSLHQNVIDSALAVYFQENLMQWVIDKIQGQSLMNTAEWRFLIPELYKKYPDDDMNLNITASSPPVVKISDHGIDAIANLDMVIDVLDYGNAIPVACIGTIIHVSGYPEISKNCVVSSIWLEGFNLNLKWSSIGNLHMHLVQSMATVVLKTAVIPYVNLQLHKGIPLPIVRGFTLENAGIFSDDSEITICSDVAFAW